MLFRFSPSIKRCPCSAGAAFVHPSAAGFRPVCRLMRVGEHTGAGAYAALNLMPCSANRAMFGVCTKLLFESGMSGCIWQDSPLQA